VRITIVDLIRKEGREPGGAYRFKRKPSGVSLPHPALSIIALAHRLSLDTMRDNAIDALSRPDPLLANVPWRKR
jgi:hypothetical protein